MEPSDSELDDAALERIRAICRQFGGADEGALQDRPVFRVGRRRFAIFNGRGSPTRARWISSGPSLHFLADPDEITALRQDGRFRSSPHHGDRGWLAIGLEDHEALDWDEIAELLESSYRQVAPGARVDRSTVAHLDLSQAFAIFDEQDSGCVSYGIARGGRRLFVKTAKSTRGRESLRRAARFHQSIRHPAIVHPVEVADTPDGPRLTYPWCEGTVLNRATVRGSDRSALLRFQGLAVGEVVAAVSTILDAHLAVAGAGFVAVDLYDGCFLYDFVAGEMRLIDLDEYRPGPFTLEADRLPGSQRYMAPEEFRRGSTIDERTTVFNLGRTIAHLLDGPAGWRGSATQRRVVVAATEPNPARRIATVAELVGMWLRASPAAQ
jgi:serine/threonine-protein kinase